MQAEERFHSLDALRGAMMLLGIVLHAACAYITVRIPEAPFQDIRTNLSMDLLLGVIHIFRLPAFFLMAGFFAAMLARKNGLSGMIRNRARRILLPLLVSWPIVAFLGLLAFRFAEKRHPHFGLMSPPSAGSAFNMDLILFHLWFLYDLFWFCLAAAALQALLSKAPAVARSIRGFFSRLLSRSAAPALLGLVTACTLLSMKHGTFDTSGSLLPPLHILAAYFVFFSFGWLLYAERSQLPVFQQGWRGRLLLGGAALIPHLVALHQLMRTPAPELPLRILACLSGGAACWWIIWGLIGAALTFFSAPRPAVRYVTDASYFIYIAHLPVVIFLHGLLAPFDVSALLKFVAVVTVATGSLLLVYDAWVRAGSIGQWLNGRRYPREIFREKLAAPPEPSTL